MTFITEHDVVLVAEAVDQVISGRRNEFGKERGNAAVYESLGHLTYLSCLASPNIVVGNSSIGIIEAPLVVTPTVNTGDLQKGRDIADSSSSVPVKKVVMSSAIGKAFQMVGARSVDPESLPYSKPNAASEIVSILGRLHRHAMSLDDG